jgi:hypothetical protein
MKRIKGTGMIYIYGYKNTGTVKMVKTKVEEEEKKKKTGSDICESFENNHSLKKKCKN